MNRDVCDVCHIGQLHLSQYTLDKAVRICDNPQCTYQFEKWPWELIVDHPIQSAASMQRWKQLTSREYRRASATVSPSPSFCSLTDKDVQRMNAKSLECQAVLAPKGHAVEGQNSALSPARLDEFVAEICAPHSPFRGSGGPPDNTTSMDWNQLEDKTSCILDELKDVFHENLMPKPFVPKNLGCPQSPQSPVDMCNPVGSTTGSEDIAGTAKDSMVQAKGTQQFHAECVQLIDSQCMNLSVEPSTSNTGTFGDCGSNASPDSGIAEVDLPLVDSSDDNLLQTASDEPCDVESNVSWYREGSLSVRPVPSHQDSKSKANETDCRDLWSLTDLTLDQVDVEITLVDRPKVHLYEPMILQAQILQQFINPVDVTSTTDVPDKTSSVPAYYQRLVSEVKYNEGFIGEIDGCGSLEDSVGLGALDWVSSDEQTSEEEIPIIGLDSEDEITLLSVQKRKKTSKRSRNINCFRSPRRSTSSSPNVETVDPPPDFQTFGSLASDLWREDLPHSYRQRNASSSVAKQIAQTPTLANSQPSHLLPVSATDLLRGLEKEHNADDTLNRAGWQIVEEGAPIEYVEKESSLPVLLPSPLVGNETEVTSEVLHWKLTSKNYQPSGDISLTKDQTRQRNNCRVMKKFLSKDDDAQYRDMPRCSPHGGGLEEHRQEIQKQLQEELNKCQTPPNVLCVSVGGKMFVCRQAQMSSA